MSEDLKSKVHLNLHPMRISPDPEHEGEGSPVSFLLFTVQLARKLCYAA